MSDFPYHQSADRLRSFMKHLQESGVPNGRFVQSDLSARGFKSKNDRPLIKLLTALGFVDQQGQATQRWRDYRDKSKSSTVLADGMREAYKRLFETYPDAHAKSEEDIRNFFSANTNAASAMISNYVKTFRTLAEMSDFGGRTAETTPNQNPQSPPAQTSSPPTITRTLSPVAGSSVTINISLEIPATDDAEVYDRFFRSMRKHLLTDES